MKFYHWLAVLDTMLSNDVHVKRPEHCAFRKSRDNYYLEKTRNNIQQKQTTKNIEGNVIGSKIVYLKICRHIARHHRKV